MVDFASSWKLLEAGKAWVMEACMVLYSVYGRKTLAEDTDIVVIRYSGDEHII